MKKRLREHQEQNQKEIREDDIFLNVVEEVINNHDEGEQLKEAARLGNSVEVEKLIQGGVLARNPKAGLEALKKAVKVDVAEGNLYGCFVSAQLLIDADAVDMRTQSEPLVQSACNKSNLWMLDLLLRKGARLDRADKSNKNFLSHLLSSEVVQNSFEMTNILLNYSSTAGTDKVFGDALINAAQKGKHKMVEALIGTGVVARNPAVGVKALKQAASVYLSDGKEVVQGCIESAELLITHAGVSPNGNGISDSDYENIDLPVRIACERDNSSMLDLLFKYGASLDCVDARGNNIMSYAVKLNSLTVVKYLADLPGANLNQRIDVNSDENILQRARECARKNKDFKQLVEFLESKGASAEIIDNRQNTYDVVVGTVISVSAIPLIEEHHKTQSNGNQSGGRWV